MGKKIIQKSVIAQKFLSGIGSILGWTGVKNQRMKGRGKEGKEVLFLFL